MIVNFFFKKKETNLYLNETIFHRMQGLIRFYRRFHRQRYNKTAWIGKTVDEILIACIFQHISTSS